MTRRPTLVVFEEAYRTREDRERIEASIDQTHTRIERALALPEHMMRRAPSHVVQRVELERSIRYALARLANVITESAMLAETYLSPAEREFLEGAHAGRH